MSPSNNPQTGTCRSCDTTMTLRSDGMIPKHGVVTLGASRKCPGSFRSPAELAGWPEPPAPAEPEQPPAEQDERRRHAALTLAVQVMEGRDFVSNAPKAVALNIAEAFEAYLRGEGDQP